MTTGSLQVKKVKTPYIDNRKSTGKEGQNTMHWQQEVYVYYLKEVKTPYIDNRKSTGKEGQNTKHWQQEVYVY